MEHPYISYAFVGFVFGVWLLRSLNPDQLRIRADNYKRFADKLEEMQSVVPTYTWQMAIVGLGSVFWSVLIVIGTYNFLYRIVWGVERVEFDEDDNKNI